MLTQLWPHVTLLGKEDDLTVAPLFTIKALEEAGLKEYPLRSYIPEGERLAQSLRQTGGEVALVADWRKALAIMRSAREATANRRGACYVCSPEDPDVLLPPGDGVAERLVLFVCLLP